MVAALYVSKCTQHKKWTTIQCMNTRTEMGEREKMGSEVCVYYFIYVVPQKRRNNEWEGGGGEEKV